MPTPLNSSKDSDYQMEQFNKAVENFEKELDSVENFEKELDLKDLEILFVKLFTAASKVTDKFPLIKVEEIEELKKVVDESRKCIGSMIEQLLP